MKNPVAGAANIEDAPPRLNGFLPGFSAFYAKMTRMVIRLPGMDPVASKYNATVEEIDGLTPDLFILKVRPDAPVAPFTSGQYVLLGLSSNIPRRPGCEPEFKEQKPDRLILRAYSIASAGHETGLLEFYVSVVSNGSLTPRLVQAKPGDRLHLGEKIRGHFTLDQVPRDREWVVLAATGTGLAPYVSMMRSEHVTPSPFRFVLLQGAPTGKDHGYVSELTAHAAALPNLTYIPSITRPHLDPDWKGDTGRITRYFDTDILRERLGVEFNPERTSVFLCGNPAMIEDVKKVLEPKGYTAHSPSSPGSLHIEEYW
jgi:ferredoxin/flavodoxin---NADP+ reductase